MATKQVVYLARTRSGRLGFFTGALAWSLELGADRFTHRFPEIHADAVRLAQHLGFELAPLETLQRHWPLDAEAWNKFSAVPLQVYGDISERLGGGR